MPRYFTDFNDGFEHHRDEVGSDLPDILEAQKQALHVFKHVGIERLIDMGSGSVVVTVRDIRDDVVFKRTLTLC